MKQTTIAHEFVEFVPKSLKPGTLYVCMPYATAAHLCCCGCGREVVTPITPTDWKVTFDGETVSLDPSIGNWSFPCRSHYWIKHNRVRWAASWSQERIDANRQHDRGVKDRHFGKAPTASPSATAPDDSTVAKVRRWWSRK
jgi:Family of unknown function (DUF6527)